MQTPLYIPELEVIGYATVLKQTMLPSVVPPVFRLKENPNQGFVPPYILNEGYLCDATALSGSELKALANKQEITLFDSDPMQAQPEFELWLDQNHKPHYEPRAQVDETLLALAKEHIKKAEEALKGGKRDAAERFSGIALCADDRLVEPLAIKAALRRLKGDPTGEKLMAKFASSKMTDDGFRVLVDAYCSCFASTRTDDTTYTRPVSVEFEVYPMHNMSLIRAA